MVLLQLSFIDEYGCTSMCKACWQEGGGIRLDLCQCIHVRLCFSAIFGFALSCQERDELKCCSLAAPCLRFGSANGTMIQQCFLISFVAPLLLQFGQCWGWLGLRKELEPHISTYIFNGNNQPNGEVYKVKEELMHCCLFEPRLEIPRQV